MNEQEYSEYVAEIDAVEARMRTEARERKKIDALNRSATCGPERIEWLIDCLDRFGHCSI